MNRFVIVDGLPYKVANGKTYAVKWDENGFTVGAAVKLAAVPDTVYSELSIKAKCVTLDSITKHTKSEKTDAQAKPRKTAAKKTSK